jgi:hypothetical protein
MYGTRLLARSSVSTNTKFGFGAWVAADASPEATVRSVAAANTATPRSG